MNMPLKIRFNRGFGGFTTKFAIFSKNPVNGDVSVATTITMATLKEGMAVSPDQEHLIDDESIQEMFDEIWRMGFRPTGVKTGDETIEALENHVNQSTKVIDRLLGIAEKGPIIIQHPERRVTVAEI